MFGDDCPNRGCLGKVWSWRIFGGSDGSSLLITQYNYLSPTNFHVVAILPRQNSMRELIRKHPFRFFKRRSNLTLGPDLEKTEDTSRRSTSSSNSAATAKNVVKMALTTLSATSNNIPICGIITSVVDPLLLIMTQLDLTSANVQGLVELVARIERLTPLVADMVEVNSVSECERRFIDDLTRELESIGTDVSETQAQGTLTRFFNNPDDAAGLARHNATLAQLVADATLVNVQEVRRMLMSMERSVSRLVPSLGQIEIGHITGGTCGMCASGGHFGHEGDGGVPEFEIPTGQNVRFGGISGGIDGEGGEGGEGYEEWVKGGVGRAPKIRCIGRAYTCSSSPEPAATPFGDEIWMPYGDIVLQVESTQFRVNRDILARHSGVFSGLFLMPRPSKDSKDTVEGCAAVHLPGDASVDWAELLEFLYDPFAHKEKLMPFGRLAAMLRLGKKYEFLAVEADAASRLRYEFPADFTAFNALDADMTKIAYRRGIYCDLLGLAYECRVYDCVPLLAFCCLRTDTLETLFKGVRRDDGTLATLPDELKTTMALALQRMALFQHESLSWMRSDSVVPDASCVAPEKCAQQLQVMARIVDRDHEGGQFNFGYTIDQWDDRWTGMLCGGCEAEAAAAYERGRVKGWDLLPTFFGLPGWDGLRDVE
ncbi:hypothetical protein FB45DRAFT_1056539 [Roridomyces roridus]|uniref:BTB domain-containing protein n=1 Tax=Roridomyces roridus TaxID=1738132 RepID=A0AAD7BYP1_9AGAR|nr:hypothetical protein FB45DRAFT_1056539 [Roridomyces roridus]